MNKLLVRRINAFLFDLILVFIVSFLISLIPIINPNKVDYQEKYNELVSITTQYVNNELSKDDYDSSIKPIMYYISKYTIHTKIVTLIVTLLYFTVVPLLMDGETLGKKLFNLKMVNEKDKRKKLTLGNYFLRVLVAKNVLFEIAQIIAILTLNSDNFYNINNVITNAGTILLYIDIAFLFIRRDNLSLHDLVSNTCVIDTQIKEEKENEKEYEEEKNNIKTTKKTRKRNNK